MDQLTGDCSPEASIATDKQLLDRFLQGNEDAFSLIVQRHAGMVRGVCDRILRNPSDTDDAFQATFFVLASRAKTIAWQESIGGWLYHVARRVSFKLRSNLGRRRDAECDAALERNAATVDPALHIGMRELGEILDQELDKLPDRFREVIILTQIEGLSRTEVATRLGITVASVKDRLERGRDLLQKRLLNRGFTFTSVTLAAWLTPGTSHTIGLQSLISSTCHMAASFAAGKLAGANATVPIALAHAFQNVMILKKASAVIALCLTLITGGSIAYGFLEDNPKRFEDGIRGRVTRLSVNRPASMTIKLDEYNALLDLDISSDVKVWIAYENTQLDKLRVGQNLAVKLGGDNRTIQEIHAQGLLREATIKDIDESGGMTFEPDDDTPGASPQTFAIPSQAILRIDGLPARRADFAPGMAVPLEFGHADTAVHAIETDANDNRILEGEITAIDLKNRTLTITTEDESDLPVRQTLRVDESTLISMGSRSSRIDELAIGYQVRLRTGATGNMVSALSVIETEVDDGQLNDE